MPTVNFFNLDSAIKPFIATSTYRSTCMKTYCAPPRRAATSIASSVADSCMLGSRRFLILALMGVSPQYRKGLYGNQGFVFALFGMKMRRTLVSEVHSNHNHKESRHLEIGRASWKECRS